MKRKMKHGRQIYQDELAIGELISPKKLSKLIILAINKRKNIRNRRNRSKGRKYRLEQYPYGKSRVSD